MPVIDNYINCASGAGDMLSFLVNAPIAYVNPAGTGLAAYTWNGVTATLPGVSVTLPVPTNRAVIGVRVTDASTQLVDLVGFGGGPIYPGGSAVQTMWKGETAILIGDGANWTKVAGLCRPLLAELRHVGNFPFGAGGVVQLPMNVPAIDNSNLMIPGGGQINIRRTGYYRYSGQATILGQSAANLTDIHQVRVHVNGIPINIASTKSTGTAADMTPTCGGLYLFNAGNIITLHGFTNEAIGAIMIGDTTLLSVNEVPQW